MMDTVSLERLVDGLIDAYVDWRDACGRVNDAYRVWALEAGPTDKVAFGLYTAALDAEERAAQVYAASVKRAWNRLWGGAAPAEALGGRAQRVSWP